MFFVVESLISTVANALQIVDFILKSIPFVRGIIRAFRRKSERPKRMSDSQYAERIRTGVLKYLASAQAQNYDFDSLLKHLKKGRSLGFKIKRNDLTGAIAFLEDKNFVKHRFHKLGSTRFYQATSAGVLAYERGLIEED